jgi:hypothetical protein
VPGTTDHLLLERRISPERLAPYRIACGGDLTRAIELYSWNAQVAGAFWESLGHVEVLVRNAMHEQLTDWSANQHADPRWYLDPGQILTTRAHDDVATARRRATERGRAETPGRVVAELSLGFWRYLTAVQYDRDLWRPALHKAFPGRSRRDVSDIMAQLHGLRNRLAHHEPVHDRPLDEIHTAALQLAGWVCPGTQAWIAGHSRVPTALAAKP